MVGRRGIRAAALLMAGLVGAALVAPGLASAQETSTTPPPACADGGALVPGSIFCTTGSPAPSTTIPIETASPGSTATSDPAAPVAPVPGLDLPGSTTGSTGSPSSASPASDAPAATTDGAPEVAASPQATTATVRRLQATVTKAESSAGASDAAAAAANPLAILSPTQVSDLLSGGTLGTTPSTTNPRAACAFFGNQLTSSDQTGLSAQFAAFCASLPTSFGTDGLTGLTDLLGALTDLLGALPQGLPNMTGTVSSNMGTPYVAPEFMPYLSGTGSNIYNCGDLDQATAQAIYAADPSDPNRLDGNNNGVACENGGTHNVSYSGYPQGGVATGDSSPLVDAAHAGSLALALVMTSGFAAAGAARRRDRDAEVAGV